MLFITKERLESVEQSLAAVVSAQDGCEELCEAWASHLATGGSRTRLLLALTVGHEAGLPESTIVHIALAVELLHQASLIHDDLQERDLTRRGFPSVWASYGDTTAINLGDLLITEAFTQLASLDPAHLQSISSLIQAMRVAVRTTICGQQRDMRLINAQISLNEYKKIVQQKTGPLLGLPVQMVLLLKQESDHLLELNASIAGQLGLAYQLIDDCLDFPEVTGVLNGLAVISGQSKSIQEAKVICQIEIARALKEGQDLMKLMPCYAQKGFKLIEDKILAVALQAKNAA
jgi:geranylgeranyl diphosphate synthase type I